MAGEGDLKRKTPLAELRSDPTPALWLAELKQCLVWNGPRSYTLNQLGSLAEHCDHQITLSENPDVTRSTLITAIEELLVEHPPEQVKLNTFQCDMLTDLVRGFSPPSGFNWTVQLLAELGLPEPDAPKLVGGEDSHAQALFALGSYFLRLPTESEEAEHGPQQVLVAQSPEMLDTYMSILDQYADSGTHYAEYAQEVRDETIAATAMTTTAEPT